MRFDFRLFNPVYDFRKFAQDSGFKESEHPRGQPKNAGQFTASGSGTKKTTPTEKNLKAEISKYKDVGMTKLNDGVSEKYYKMPPEEAAKLIHPGLANKGGEITRSELDAIYNWTTPADSAVSWERVNKFLRQGSGHLTWRVEHAHQIH